VPATLRDALRGVASAGRPLLLSPSVVASGGALRGAADALVAAQRAIVEAGVDLVVAPTSETTAPALHRSGQAYRAAALTAAAIDLSRDAIFAARRSAWVLGEIDADAGPKAMAEARTHVERLATSAVDGMLVRARDPEATSAIVRGAQAHALPVVVELAVDAIGSIVSSDLAPPAVLLVRGEDVPRLRGALAAIRTITPNFLLGMRLVVPDDRDRAQVFVAEAWDEIAHEGLAVLGVDGAHAGLATRALVDLVRADRLSLAQPTG